MTATTTRKERIKLENKKNKKLYSEMGLIISSDRGARTTEERRIGII